MDLLFKKPMLYNFAPQRSGMVFEMDEAKSMQDMATNAEKLENWGEKSGDEAQNEINTQCDKAINENKRTTDEAVKRLDEEQKKKVDEILATEKAEPENKKSAAWNKWKKDHDEIWNRIKTVQQETARKKGEAVKAHETARNQFYKMRDTAIHKMRAAFEVRAKSEEAIKQSLETVAGDHEDVREAMKRASFAADLADDGTLSSWGGEVQDYLDSEIGGRKLNDSELEDITMGIVAAMHSGDKNDENDPARKFMRGLSDREDNSGEFWSTDDRGVRARDVQLQILQNLGYNVTDRDERGDAVDSDAGKLVAKIASNSDLPPQLRGMLLGRLATAKEGEREDMVKRVGQMFELAQKAKAGGADATKIELPGNTAEEVALALAAIPAALLVVPTMGASAVGWGAMVQGHKDERALGQAGVVFTALEDAQKMIEFNEMRSRYETEKKISGRTDSKIEEMIKSADTPSKMRKAVREGKFRTALAEYSKPPEALEAAAEKKDDSKDRTAVATPDTDDNTAEKPAGGGRSGGGGTAGGGGSAPSDPRSSADNQSEVSQVKYEGNPSEKAKKQMDTALQFVAGKRELPQNIQNENDANKIVNEPIRIVPEFFQGGERATAYGVTIEIGIDKMARIVAADNNVKNSYPNLESLPSVDEYSRANTTTT